MTKEQATKLIAECMERAWNAVNEAVAIAEDSGVVFHLPWGGEGTSQAGMGATYIPTTATPEDKDAHNYYGYREDGWMPSAGTC